MTTIYAANIREVGKNIDVILGSALDLSIYPLMEQNFKAFLTASIQSSNYKKIKKMPEISFFPCPTVIPQEYTE